MGDGRKITWIERLAARAGWVPERRSLPQPAHLKDGHLKDGRLPDGRLESYPPFEKWQNWEELDAQRRPRRYTLIPTTCFNCESGCGLLAYVDQDSGEVHKIEGNPLHPGSRGRNCAKGPATLNQTRDPERILHPLKQSGARGSGEWQQVTWDEALDDIAERIRKALDEGRGEEVMYHVGRPGHEGYMERVLKAWGIDGHNSHTNICSASARLGYHLTFGQDRPSPDFANANLLLLFSAHLESGHYFNPHAQRIVEAKNRGARLVVIDPRLSNTASRADLWIPAWPGTEAAVLLAAVRLLLEQDSIHHAFVKQWVDWRGFLKARHPEDPFEFSCFLERLKEAYERYTPEYAAQEAHIPVALIHSLAA